MLQQPVLLQSVPEGADVYQDGKKIGTTDAFVFVDRSKRPEVELRFPDGRRKAISLQTKFRWKDSFAKNLIFLIYAPLGWSVDLMTGNAWDIEDPSVWTNTPSQVKNQHKKPQTPLVFAIAPPQYGYLAQSDDAALALEPVLRKQYPGAIVLPYRKTLPIFTSHGYDFNAKPDENDKRRIYQQLAANRVFESTLTDANNGIVLDGQSTDVFSGQTGMKTTVAFHDPKTTTESSSFSVWGPRHRLLYLLPNNLSIDVGRRDMALSINGQNHTAADARTDSLLDQTSAYVGAIGLTHQERPRAERNSHWRFNFVPAMTFSHNRSRFWQVPEIADVTFERWRIAAGLGPEVGWQYGNGYTYFNALPEGSFTSISAQDETSRHTTQRFSVDLSAEIGFLYYITDGFNVRLFSRSVNEDKQSWSRAFESVSKSKFDIDGVTWTYVGFSVGYTFDSGPSLKNWSVAGK